MAGDYADMSWDPEEPESWYRQEAKDYWELRRFRYRPLKYEQRTNQVVFSDFVDKPIDPSQF